MSTEKCSFCGHEKNEVPGGRFIKGKGDALICDDCVGQAANLIGTKPKESNKEPTLGKPREIKAFLDEHIISQERLKKAVATAVYHHFKRRDAARLKKAGAVKIQKSNMLVLGPTGCHRKGQPVLMHDGTLKAVENVRVGDQLMGPDSKPRTVLELRRGRGKMVEIQPVKGDPFVVNEGHVLTLMCNHRKNKGKLIDVSVQEWLTWSKTQKHIHKLVRTGVEFPKSRAALTVDPYFLGVFLGDGSFNLTPRVHTTDSEILAEVRRQARKFGLKVVRHDQQGEDDCPAYALSRGREGIGRGKPPNPLALRFGGLGLWNVECHDRFVPTAYKVSSRKTRLALLAGLLDTDGSRDGKGYDFISKSKELTNDVTFIARSLGFAAYPRPCEKRDQNGKGGTYHRVYISGETSEIPVRIRRKKVKTRRRQVKSVLHTGFSVRSLGTERYYGFLLDKDHRYLLDDFTVTHNSGKTETFRAISEMLKVPFYVQDCTRLTQQGYVGDDADDMLRGLLQNAGGDVERASWGIILLDEFDKIARKSGRSASGYRDITGEGVQQGMLRILEGAQVPVTRGMGKNVSVTSVGPNGEVRSNVDVLDTTNILFVCAGSFAGIEEIVDQRVNKSSHLGFGSGDHHKKKLSKSDVYLAVKQEDILEFGIIPEMLGRLPVITTTLELSDEDMVRVLTEPKNAIVKQFQALFAMDDIALQFDKDALLAIGAEAKKRPTGARGLRGLLEEILSPYAYDAPSIEDIVGLRITADVVSGKAPAVLMHQDKTTKRARA